MGVELPWDEALDLVAAELARVRAEHGDAAIFGGSHGWASARDPADEGSKRLLAAAAAGSPARQNRPLTGMAGLRGAQGNTAALVGTPDQVAEAMLDDHDLGTGTILIRGLGPIEDAFRDGRDLSPRVRDLVARRDAGATRAAAAE